MLSLPNTGLNIVRIISIKRITLYTKSSLIWSQKKGYCSKQLNLFKALKLKENKYKTSIIYIHNYFVFSTDQLLSYSHKVKKNVMQIWFDTFYHINSLLEIHPYLVPKQTILTSKNYKCTTFIEYVYEKNNKERILVTILPAKRLIKIKCWRLMKFIF